MNGIIGINNLTNPRNAQTFGGMTETLGGFDMFSITKKCTKCEEIKSKFRPEKKMRDGFSSWCLDCKNSYDREFSRKYRREHPEKARASVKKYAENHPDYVREKSREWQAAHPETSRAWRQNNLEKIRDWARRKWAEDPEKYRQKTRNYRAKKRLSGKITKNEWQAILDRYGHKCLYPRCDRTDVEMDHIIPVAIGGTHTIDNVQPLCRFHNAQKHTKVIDYR
jgi:hypothetical protein